MLTHTIAPYKPKQGRVSHFQQQVSKKFKGDHGGEDHMRFIFERTVKNCKFKQGDIVLYKREKWQVIYIDREFVPGICWDGLSANIVTIYRDRGNNEDEMIQVHPSRLKRNR